MIQAAIMGFGTVGSGVAEVLTTNGGLIDQRVENLVRLEAKEANLESGTEITIRDLIRAALRMRPNRVIIGEVRGAETFELLSALICTI